MDKFTNMFEDQIDDFGNRGTRKQQATFKKFILRIRRKQKLSFKKNIKELNKLYQRKFGRSYLKNNGQIRKTIKFRSIANDLTPVYPLDETQFKKYEVHYIDDVQEFKPIISDDKPKIIY